MKFLSLDFIAKTSQLDELIDEAEFKIYQSSFQSFASISKSLGEEVEELKGKLFELKKLSEEIQTKILIECKRR
jgi:hypothetical protein